MVEEDLNGLVSTIAALSGFSNPMKETYYRPASIGQIAKLRGQIEKIPELVSLCRKISLLFSRTMHVRVLHPSDRDKLDCFCPTLEFVFHGFKQLTVINQANPSGHSLFVRMPIIIG